MDANLKTVQHFEKELATVNDEDAGYSSSNDEDDLVHDALHPEKFHTIDEIDHKNDVPIEGVDKDNGLNDEII